MALKLSLVTSAYNSASTIRDTFESVLSQTYKDYEYWIIDGGSKDATIDIIKEYEKKFEGRMKWVSEPDNGIYDAMTKGFKKCTGNVLMLINSDDLFAQPDVFQMIVDKFDENPDVDGIYADLYYVSQYNIKNIVRVWKTGVQKSFAKGWLPAHPTFYVKREIYLKYGYFDLSYTLAADFELMLRFVEGYGIKLCYLPEYLVRMRLGGATSKNARNIFYQNIECYQAFKKNGIRHSPFYILYRYFPKIKQFFRKSK